MKVKTLQPTIIDREGLLPRSLMGSGCKVAVLIPVYDEPVGLLLNVLLSLAAQKNVLKKDYEIFVVVNNNRRQAKESSPEFLQNQKTLQFIAYLNCEIPVCPFDLNREQQQIMFEIRKSGLQIRLTDKSSVRFADALNNCGSAKNFGGTEICRRFGTAKAGSNGIIALLDCDCRVSESFLKEILETFKNPEINLVAGKWLTEVDPSHPYSEALAKAAAIHFGVDNSLKNFKVSKKRLIIQLQKGDKHKKPIARIGHNMAVRVSAWLAVGGFPRLSSFDDIIFGQRITELPGDVAFNPNYWVCNLLRPSERAGMASIGRRMKAIIESIEYFAEGRGQEVLLPDLRKINRLFLAVFESLNQDLLTPELLLGHLKNYGVSVQNLTNRDVFDLCMTITSEFREKECDHGWERTEALVLSRFYQHLPKQVFPE